MLESVSCVLLHQSFPYVAGAKGNLWEHKYSKWLRMFQETVKTGLVAHKLDEMEAKDFFL